MSFPSLKDQQPQLFSRSPTLFVKVKIQHPIYEEYYSALKSVSTESTKAKIDKNRLWL